MNYMLRDNLLRDNLLSALLVGAGFATVAVLYPRMPEVIPTHWGLDGQANGWMPKVYGAWVLPLSAGAVWLTLLGARLLSPRGWEIERFAGPFNVISTLTIAVLFVLTVSVSWVAVGGALDMGVFTTVSVAVLLVVLGNYMGKLRRNFFVGIRTPWTLASEEVWLRTHRLGGRLFVAAGAASLLAATLGQGTVVLLVSVLLAAAVAVVYSYLVYRRINPA